VKKRNQSTTIKENVFIEVCTLNLNNDGIDVVLSRLNNYI